MGKQKREDPRKLAPSERRRYFERGVRKHFGARERIAWVVRLREACGVELGEADFLTLEETEKFEERLWRRVGQLRAANSRLWPGDSGPAVGQLLNGLEVHLGGLSVVLLHCQSNYLGAVRMLAGPVLRNALDVWSVLGGREYCDLPLATDDLEHGLALEFNALSEDRSGNTVRNVYELVTWGRFETAVAARTGAL